MALSDPAAPTVVSQQRYVLITQCLQNDFFLNSDCRLYLSDAEVKKLLVAKHSHEDNVFEVNDGHRRVKDDLLRAGPLGLFLEATVGARLKDAGKGTLHASDDVPDPVRLRREDIG